MDRATTIREAIGQAARWLREVNRHVAEDFKRAPFSSRAQEKAESIIKAADGLRRLSDLYIGE